MDQVGRFRIIKELGRGAMGVVFQAIDPTIGRSVAIKTIRLREVDDSEQRARLRERLFREARSAGVLSHPNIVTIYDMDEEDGTAYIAMQYVNGPTVEALLDGAGTGARPPIGPDQIFRILRQTAAALDFAHSKGIVHRDIKPANIMIDEDGTVKIADFGIAKASAAGNLTASGTILGTPNYMSPEQVQGSAISGRSDQFSLGVVAYEMLTGERPFAGENLGTVVYRIVAEVPAEPSLVNPALGEEIGRVLQQALQKNPKRRFLSCTEFANALIAACEATPGWHQAAHSAVRAAQPVLATEDLKTAPTGRRSRMTASVTVSPVLPPDPSSRVPPSRLPAAAEPQRSAPVFLPALGAFAVVLGVLGLVAWQTSSTTTPAPNLKAQLPEKTTEPAPVEDVETPPVVEPVKTDSASSAPVREPETDSGEAKTSEKPTPERKGRPAASAAMVAAKPSLHRVAFGGVATLPASVLSPVPPPPVPLQDVSVVTNPPGATVTLDGHTESACQTPCLLLSEPGIHLLFLSLRDYQPERRQLRIGSAREEVPLITLRPVGGTLMVSSIPPGANIFVNDKMLAELTPAQLSLQPGSYDLAVERDGVRKGEQVIIKNGVTNYLRIPFPE